MFCFEGGEGINLPRNTLVIVSIKCVYRDKRGFAAAEPNNSHSYCCFRLCLVLRGELGDGSKRRNKSLYKDCQSSHSTDLTNASKATEIGVLGLNLLSHFTVCCRVVTFRRAVKFYFMVLPIKRRM